MYETPVVWIDDRFVFFFVAVGVGDVLVYVTALLVVVNSVLWLPGSCTYQYDSIPVLWRSGSCFFGVVCVHTTAVCWRDLALFC